jgi:hypothetical protein
LPEGLGGRALRLAAGGPPAGRQPGAEPDQDQRGSAQPPQRRENSIGLLLVAAAVSIPFWLTHRRMRPNKPAEAHAYLDAKDEVAQTEDTAQRRRAFQAAMVRRTRGTQQAGPDPADQPADPQARFP